MFYQANGVVYQMVPQQQQMPATYNANRVPVNQNNNGGQNNRSGGARRQNFAQNLGQNYQAVAPQNAQVYQPQAQMFQQPQPQYVQPQAQYVQQPIQYVVPQMQAMQPQAQFLQQYPQQPFAMPQQIQGADNNQRNNRNNADPPFFYGKPGEDFEKWFDEYDAHCDYNNFQDPRKLASLKYCLKDYAFGALRSRPANQNQEAIDRANAHNQFVIANLAQAQPQQQVQAQAQQQQAGAQVVPVPAALAHDYDSTIRYLRAIFVTEGVPDVAFRKFCQREQQPGEDVSSFYYDLERLFQAMAANGQYNEHALMLKFINGLLPPYRAIIHLQRPANVREALDEARRMESRFANDGNAASVTANSMVFGIGTAISQNVNGVTVNSVNAVAQVPQLPQLFQQTVQPVHQQQVAQPMYQQQQPQQMVQPMQQQQVQSGGQQDMNMPIFAIGQSMKQAYNQNEYNDAYNDNGAYNDNYNDDQYDDGQNYQDGCVTEQSNEMNAMQQRIDYLEQYMLGDCNAIQENNGKSNGNGHKRFNGGAKKSVLEKPEKSNVVEIKEKKPLLSDEILKECIEFFQEMRDWRKKVESSAEVKIQAEVATRMDAMEKMLQEREDSQKSPPPLQNWCAHCRSNTHNFIDCRSKFQTESNQRSRFRQYDNQNNSRPPNNQQRYNQNVNNNRNSRSDRSDDVRTNQIQDSRSNQIQDPAPEPNQNHQNDQQQPNQANNVNGVVGAVENFSNAGSAWEFGEVDYFDLNKADDRISIGAIDFSKNNHDIIQSEHQVPDLLNSAEDKSLIADVQTLVYENSLRKYNAAEVPDNFSVYERYPLRTEEQLEGMLRKRVRIKASTVQNKLSNQARGESNCSKTKLSPGQKYGASALRNSKEQLYEIQARIGENGAQIDKRRIAINCAEVGENGAQIDKNQNLNQEIQECVPIISKTEYEDVSITLPILQTNTEKFNSPRNDDEIGKKNVDEWLRKNDFVIIAGHNEVQNHRELFYLQVIKAVKWKYHWCPRT